MVCSQIFSGISTKLQTFYTQSSEEQAENKEEQTKNKKNTESAVKKLFSILPNFIFG